MPLKYFECPDGEKIIAEDCIKNCRMFERCATRPTLYSLLKGSKDREATWWDNEGNFIPHVTDLLNGTRATWYKVMMPYTIRPVDMGDLLLGTGTHAGLEEMARALGDPTEVGLELYDKKNPSQGDIPIATGSADYLELIWNENDLEAKYRLIDYKTYGIYLAQKLLGLKRTKINGKWAVINAPPDFSSVEMQMNSYRVMCEDFGYRIGEMVIQMIVKEGGFMFAQSGIDHKIMMVEVPKMKDSWVRKFLALKAELLRQHVSDNTEPAVCNVEERWNDLKCKSFCEVAEFCAHGKMMKAEAAPVIR